ncbi:MAG: ribosome small subunit-dependent GTPase A [Cyanobacteriota bacterium]
MAESGVNGQVVALLANFCWVELDQPGPRGRTRLLCTRRTRLGKSGLQICTGDRVRLEGIDWSAGRAAVGELVPRLSLLERPAVANVTRVVVVVALAEPDPDPLQLTRFLITAEATGQPVELVFSKAELLKREALQRWCSRAQTWGYEPIALSPATGLGLERLRERLCQPGLAVLCGPSGVGKSSLLNALRPELDLRVGTVSGRLQRGRHTTRHVELFSMAPGALVADSPGFNRPALPPDPATLAPLFPELRQQLAVASCRFSNCLHQGDPGCAIRPGWDREPLYRECLAALLAEGARQQQRDGSDPGVRQRGGRLEPRLDPRLRQDSRRRQRQQAEHDQPLEDLSRSDPAG